MFQQNGVTGKLFSKSIPVTIKGSLSNQCRRSSLFLTVEWVETAAAILHQELKISLTDNNDPFFLYDLHLTEEDYQVLKSNQGLLVDFRAFPQKFIDLIEVCLAEDSKNQPEFLLLFDVNDKIGSIRSSSQLDIVQTNPFKHLVHLSLKFLPGSESSVKQYLTLCFKNLKESKHQLESRLTFLEQDFKDKLSSCQANLEKKSLELETVRNKLSVELSEKENTHSRQLQQERERFLSKQREEESRTYKERREKEQSLKEEIHQLESRVSILDTSNKDLQKQNQHHVEKISDLRSRVSSYEEEIKRLKEMNTKLKDQNSALQKENRENKDHLCDLKRKIEDQTHDVKKKQQEIEQLEEQSILLNRNKKNLEKEVEEIQDRLHQRANECDTLHQRIEKANKIIKNIQEDMIVVEEKLRSRTTIINKLEKSVSDKESFIAIMQKDLKEFKTDNKKKGAEIKSLKDTVTSLQEKVNHYEKDVKAKDNVIKFLNRELTDRCATPRYVPPPHLTPSSTGSNQALIDNAGGDTGAETNLNLYSSDENEKPKSLPNRISSSSLKVPSSGDVTKSASKTNSGPESVSAALSPSFGSSHLLKHNTAKKLTFNKSMNRSRKNP